ncbi:MAG TPA: hypothetical protein GXX42_01995 [Petrimonas sp.]|uniref:hypothetical protein n=1 Tax=Petrimonas sp. TaxID=2023866 RepID=UPI001754FF24|nr:hypothetical protein [Petrimonas sp.]
MKRKLRKIPILDELTKEMQVLSKAEQKRFIGEAMESMEDTIIATIQVSMVFVISIV